MVRVNLTSARRDSDGDGLADFVESRLGTDPERKDSDSDGIDDSKDPFPRVPFHEPSTEIEEETAAVFEQFHLFEEATSDLVVFVSELALPASGREGSTLIVAPKALDAFKAKSGLDGAAFIGIGPNNAGGARVAGPIAAFTRGSAGPFPTPDPRDRRYGLTIYRGPLNAVGYDIIVRRTERGCLVRSLRQVWVS